MTDFLSKFPPDMALEELKTGNKRFLEGKMLLKDYGKQVAENVNGQNAIAVVLSCMDPRIVPEIIFDQGIGRIFTIRIGGNIATDDAIGGMEFACKTMGVRLIVVLGHSKCGAVKAACDNIKMGYLTELVSKIMPSVIKVQTTGSRNSSNNEFVEMVSEQNVRDQVERIKTHGTVLGDMILNQSVKITGGMYSVESGNVDFFRE